MREVKDGFDLWANVDSILDAQGLTNIQLAQRIGIGYRTITTQRNRHTIPNALQFATMAQALGVSMEYLLTGKDSRPLSEEARLVEGDDELKALVRAVRRDRRLLSAVSAVVLSYEDTEGKKA